MQEKNKIKYLPASTYGDLNTKKSVQFWMIAIKYLEGLGSTFERKIKMSIVRDLVKTHLNESIQGNHNREEFS